MSQYPGSNMDGTFGYGGGSGGFAADVYTGGGGGYGGGIGGLGDYYGGGYDDYYGGYGGGDFYNDYYGGGYGGGFDDYYGDSRPRADETMEEYEARQPQQDPDAIQDIQAEGSQDPYMSSSQTQTTTADPAFQQLMYGLDGKGGFIPGAMQAAQKAFFDEQGNPIINPQEIAGMSQDQLDAQKMARGLTGVQDRYLSEAEQAYKTGIGQLQQGQDAARRYGLQGLEATQSGVAEEKRLREAGLSGLLGSLEEGRGLARDATQDLYGRLGETEGIRRGATDEFGRRLGEAEGIQRGATGQFGQEARDIARGQVGATGQFGGRLGESEQMLRGTTGGYDQDLTKQFYDPYEDRVVDQTIDDAMKGAAQAEVAQRFGDLRSGGESAFGSRARLGAGERQEALGRGLAKEIAGIRSRGFTEAQRAGTSEFARQKQAERTAASGLAGMAGQRLGSQQQLGSTLRGISGDVLGAQRGLASGLGTLGSQRFGSQQQLASGLGQTAGQRYGAGTGLGQTLVGYGQAGQQAQAGAGQAALGSAGQLAGAYGQMGGLEGQMGQQQFQAQQGLGGFMQGLGGQAQQAGMAGVGMLNQMGGQQQQYQQRLLDAQRANAMQAQMAPLSQYQAMLPFIQAAPQGQQTTQQQYTPRPSPLMAGMGVGLSTLGGIGSFMNQGRSPYGYGYGGGATPR